MADTRHIDLMPNGTIYDLKKGRQYHVRKTFTDYYGSEFKEEEILTFQEKHFPPYHGGQTIQFQGINLYLQEEVNAAILDSLWECLEPL
jgi:hypothetical protein